jgi:hypothetical protein
MIRLCARGGATHKRIHGRRQLRPRGGILRDSVIEAPSHNHDFPPDRTPGRLRILACATDWDSPMETGANRAR